MPDIHTLLAALSDPAYRDFSARLIPGVPKETMLGVRIPAIRKLARELDGTPEALAFLRQLPHACCDENNLHAALIERIRDSDACIAALDVFLPHVNNWATCDIMSPKCFKSSLPRLLSPIRRWMDDVHPYTCRFGMGMLLKWYLDGAFDPQQLQWVAAVRRGEYYVNMMIAWYFATALTKQYDAALPYLAEGRLDRWTHNKAIQKACESNRIPAERKKILQGMRRKGE